MNRIFILVKSYFSFVALILLIKLFYNYLNLWSKVSRMKELSIPEMHIVIFLNAMMFAFVSAAFVLGFLTLHALLSAYKVKRENKKTGKQS